MLFIEVPDPTPGKPRTHFDLRPRERGRDDEVAWLLEYGATQVADHRGIYGPGSGWVTFADPEGNLFCILRSEAELAATSSEGAGGGSLTFGEMCAGPLARAAPAVRVRAYGLESHRAGPSCR